MKTTIFKRFFVAGLTLLLPGTILANSLGEVQVWPVGSNPRGLVSADLDGDGRAEAIVANFGAATLIGQTTTASSQASITVLSQGKSGLEIKQSLKAGISPRGLATADLDGDGDLDLVVTNYDEGTVGVFLQNDQALFGTMQTVPAGTHPVGVATASLQGSVLVAVANYDNDNVSLYKANSDGSLRSIATLAVGSRPTDVELYPQGSKLLLISANYLGNTVSVITIDVNGRQSQSVVLPAPGSPCKVLVGDLTGDGLGDLVVAKFSTSEVAVYPGDATGFSPEAEVVKLTGSRPNGIALGDPAGLGKLAIVSANRDSDTVDVIARGKDGKLATLVSLSAASDDAKTFGPVEVSVADFNGDGLNDIAITHMRTGSLRTFNQVPPAAPALVSSSHPDQGAWYPNNNVTLNWDAVADLNGIKRYFFMVNKAPVATPDTTEASTSQTEITFLGLGTGTFYAHVLAQDVNGNLGSVSHYRVQITSEMTQENVYNYPNPSRDGRTTIRFPLTSPVDTLVRIYDGFGNLVWSRDLSSSETIAGVNTVLWEGRNDRGQAVGNGGYILQVSAGGKTVTKKIAIVR